MIKGRETPFLIGRHHGAVVDEAARRLMKGCRRRWQMEKTELPTFRPRRETRSRSVICRRRWIAGYPPNGGLADKQIGPLQEIAFRGI
jgi:hypothetical protein